MVLSFLLLVQIVPPKVPSDQVEEELVVGRVVLAQLPGVPWRQLWVLPPLGVAETLQLLWAPLEAVESLLVVVTEAVPVQLVADAEEVLNLD